MESKYYTPELSEFYVGFEFEFETGIDGWKKFTFNENKANQVLSNVQDFTTQFRVKYLDKEDIESLGFKITKIYGGEGDEYEFDFQSEEKGGVFYDISYDLDDHKMIIERFEKSNPFNETLYNSITVFNGTVKNKSEFKKLMQQLNIQ